MYLQSLNGLKSYVDNLEVKSTELLMILAGDKSAIHVEEMIS